MNNTTKQKPSGYWNYETCYQEAKKYNSRNEFKKGCESAYNVARKNNWLDNYTWFIKKKKTNGYWYNYENNYNEAKKYNSRIEFIKGCESAYNVALKNNWLDSYTWFTEQQKPSGYWNYETCYQEAQKYNSRSEFAKGCDSAYKVARKNGWLDNYTWFSVSKTAKKWNYETCYQEAQKYNSRNEFAKGCSGAYNIALKNNWLDNYNWLIRPKQHNIKWVEQTCYNEAQKYTSRSEFQKGCGSAYEVARKNGWLDIFFPKA